MDLQRPKDTQDFMAPIAQARPFQRYGAMKGERDEAPDDLEIL